MGSEHFGRREVLTAAGAGLVAAAGLGGTAAASPAVHKRRIAGGWMITRTVAGQPGETQTVLTLADGGAFQALDIDPGAPPLAGSWEADGPDGFEATFWGSASDQTGAPAGTVRVKATGHVTGNRLSGFYTFRANVQGQTQTGSGRFHGSRINPG